MFSNKAEPTGRHPPRQWRGNVLLVVLSLSLLALAMEFIVFRFIFPATDIPANAWANGLVKYAPEQRGVYRVKNEIEAPYRINDSGWNSG